MDLRQLRYFVAVATDLNFSRAAERLHISQPPLSQQVKQLEEELGVQLFHRTSRAVELTEIGKLFLHEAGATLERAQLAIETTRRAAHGEAGHIAIATLSTADIMVFPRLIPSFARQYPGVKLTFHHMSEVEQAAALDEGRVQVGFATLPVMLRDDCVSESIHREQIVAALPVTHRFAGRPSLDLGDLAGEDWVLPDPHRTPSAHFTVMSLCAAHGFTPHAVQFCENVQFMLSLIAAGLGVAALPERVRLMPRDRVVLIPLSAPTSMVELGMIYSPRRMTPALRIFLDMARAAFASPSPSSS